MTTSGHNVGLEEEKPMNDTPRTDVAWKTTPSVYDFIVEMKRIERELNAANIEIEEKRKDVVWLATEKAKSENYVTELENRLRALWDKYDGDRKHYNDRIKRLEDRIHRAAMAFFRDGSDGHVASGMLAILEEERGKK